MKLTKKMLKKIILEEMENSNLEEVTQGTVVTDVQTGLDKMEVLLTKTMMQIGEGDKQELLNIIAQIRQVSGTGTESPGEISGDTWSADKERSIAPE